MRKAAERLAALRTPEGEPAPPNTLAELQRGLTRLAVIKAQIKAIEEARLQRLKAAPAQGTHPMLPMLAKVLGVGVAGSPKRKALCGAPDRRHVGA